MSHNNKILLFLPLLLQGIVLGPQEFATGLARGVKSLLGHAIGL